MKMSISEILVAIIAGLLIVACTVMLVTEDSYAEDYIDASLGMFHNGYPGPANVKFGQIGHRDRLGLGFFNQYEGGGWVQVNVGDGRKSAGYVADQVGVEVDNGAVIRLATGPALLSTTDSYLGGHFQFTEDLFMGLRDSRTTTAIGFKYKHFSSAGLEMPNRGRDFGGIEISFPF